MAMRVVTSTSGPSPAAHTARWTGCGMSARELTGPAGELEPQPIMKARRLFEGKERKAEAGVRCFAGCAGRLLRCSACTDDSTSALQLS